MYYSEEEARRLVIEAGRKLTEKNLVARTWGNISARIDKDRFVITPSGKAYEDLAESGLVVVDIADCSYEGDIRPSSEKGVHADAYRLRDEVSFIVHTHQYYASVVAAECRDTHFAPCGEYGAPGSTRLRKNMEKCVDLHPECDVFLMARHGALFLGKDSEEAFRLAEELEERCRKRVLSRLPDSIAEELRECGASGNPVHDAEEITGDAGAERPAFDPDSVKTAVLPYVAVASDPFILECCRAGRTLAPYLDDFAQIAGPDAQVTENDPWSVRRALLGYSTDEASRRYGERMPMTGVLGRMGGQHPVLNGLIGRNAVLVKGVGAVCAGKTESDAGAIASIVSKNCAAACYVRYAKPLGRFDAMLQRYAYLADYSRRIVSVF